MINNDIYKEFNFDKDISLILERNNNIEHIIIKLGDNEFDIKYLLSNFIIDKKSNKILKKENLYYNYKDYIDINVDYLLNKQDIILNLLSDLITNKGYENYFLKDIYQGYKPLLELYNNRQNVKSKFKVAILMDNDNYVLYLYPTFKKFLSFKKGSDNSIEIIDILIKDINVNYDDTSISLINYLKNNNFDINILTNNNNKENISKFKKMIKKIEEDNLIKKIIINNNVITKNGLIHLLNYIMVRKKEWLYYFFDSYIHSIDQKEIYTVIDRDADIRGVHYELLDNKNY